MHTQAVKLKLFLAQLRKGMMWELSHQWPQVTPVCPCFMPISVVFSREVYLLDSVIYKAVRQTHVFKTHVLKH